MQKGLSVTRKAIGDGYTDQSTFILAGTRRITIFVYNNSVAYQLANDDRGTQWDLQESELPQGFFSLRRDCSGIRFRNYVAGQVAVVSADLLF